MYLFNDIKTALVTFIFQNMDNYSAFIGDLETFNQGFISFIIDFISFIVPLSILISIFVIPFYFILKAFNKVIKNLRTNVITEEERFVRKKRK